MMISNNTSILQQHANSKAYNLNSPSTRNFNTKNISNNLISQKVNSLTSELKHNTLSSNAKSSSDMFTLPELPEGVSIIPVDVEDVNGDGVISAGDIVRGLPGSTLPDIVVTEEFAAFLNGAGAPSYLVDEDGLPLNFGSRNKDLPEENKAIKLSDIHI